MDAKEASHAVTQESVLEITWDEFDRGAKGIARQVAQHMHEEHERFDVIYARPRGGLTLGVRLSYLLGLPLVTDEARITQRTLVVDDSTVTGKTLARICAKYRNRSAVFIHKPDLSVHTPDFIALTTTKQVNYPWEAVDDRN